MLYSVDHFMDWISVCGEPDMAGLLREIAFYNPEIEHIGVWVNGILK